MVAYAHVSDLAARWRPLTPEEEARAAILLEDASVRVDAVFPPSDPPTEAQLMVRKIVVCEMVKRAMSAPGGIGVSSVQQGAGPYQETLQFTNPTGDLYLSKSDRILLGGGRARAFSIDLTPAAARHWDGWDL